MTLAEIAASEGDSLLQIDPLRANMRLEALRLALRNDLTAEAIIERANVLLAWIEQPADKPV